MKNIFYTIILVSITFFSCSKDNCNSTDWKDGCFCTMQVEPVCGCDGKTYSNACEAECQGITDYTIGGCK